MMIEELTGARIPSVWCRFGGGDGSVGDWCPGVI